VAVFILIFTANSFASPHFRNVWNLSDATFNFTEQAMIAFAMAMLIIAGEIDLSVASIIALASTAKGLVMSAGYGVPVIVITGVAVGVICGALVAGMKLPSIVVTIGTISLFRGVSFIILGDQAFTGHPKEFAFFGQGYVFWVISFELFLFAVTAALFYTSRCTAPILAAQSM
jgi:rhamnose transport system permease protein